MSMKKRIIVTIASITLIGGVTAGALMNQPKEDQTLPAANGVTFDGKVEELVATEKIEEKPVEVVQEKTINASNYSPAPQEPEVEYITQSEGYFISPELLTPEQLYRLSELRFSFESVRTAVANTYKLNPEKFTRSAYAGIVSSCGDQVITAIRAAKEAGIPYDYRIFVCDV